jgi:hypothetical protein
MGGVRGGPGADQLSRPSGQVTLTRRRVGLLGVLAAVAGLGAACGRDEPEPVGPAASDSTPPTARATIANTDLSTVLVRPDGYVPIPGDALSGPVGPKSVPVIFVDHPADAQTILDHGFVQGHMQGWKTEVTSVDPTTIAATTTVFGIVLRFRDQAAASDVLAYFRSRAGADGGRPFVVPDALTGGYGVATGPDTVGISTYAVAWTEGVDLLQLTMQHLGGSGTAQQVLDLAVTQNGARRP